MRRWRIKRNKALSCAGRFTRIRVLRMVTRRVMMIWLNSAMRWRAALAVAALYAFCVLVPSVALALTNAAAHCLIDAHGAAHVHRAIANTHVHADGVAHKHHDKAAHTHTDEGAPNGHTDAGDKAHDGNCCGLFCITALAHEAPAALSAPAAVSRALPALADFLSGRGSDRINRPPIG
jgi:hypothetical protein